MFSNFSLANVGEIWRRTTTGALLIGVSALVVGFSFGYLLIGVGVCIGLLLGVINMRLMDRSVTRVSEQVHDNAKRPLAFNTLQRMGLVTVVAFGLTFLSHPLGLGTFAGLAIFEFLMIIGAARTLATAGAAGAAEEVAASDVVESNVVSHATDIVETSGPLVEGVVRGPAVEVGDDSGKDV